MLNKAQIVSVLSELGASPTQKMGQNFLIDENVLNKGVAMAEISNEDTVLEIGPGLGAFTQKLLEGPAKKVVAIEKDRAFAKYLRREYPQLELIEGDALEFDYANFGNHKIVANLPFAITSPLLEKFLEGMPSHLVLVVQKELADRYTATSGRSFCALSVFLQSAYTLKIEKTIPGGAFYPAPKIESCLLRMDRKADIVRFTPKAQKLIRSLFLNRRKQIHKGANANPISKEWFAKLVDEGKLKPTARAEEIPLELWQRLAQIS